MADASGPAAQAGGNAVGGGGGGGAQIGGGSGYSGATAISVATTAGATSNHSENSNYKQKLKGIQPKISTVKPGIDQVMSPLSPTIPGAPNLWSRKNTSLYLEDYFEGPRDMSKHSKLPLFMRMHGSILPKMIVPLLFVAAWSSWITVVHMLVDGVSLSVSSILLTVTGFVVGLSLSFRSSTAYERYAEGRKLWTSLILSANNIGRGIWVHARERHNDENDPDLGKRDVLGKLTAMNLLVAFSVALKHKLRWEPYTDYEDLSGLVGHLDSFAREATTAAFEDGDAHKRRSKPGFFKATGQYLGISFAASNPRKAFKRATRPLGNLPLEILAYLAAYTDELVENEQLPVGMTQTLMYNSIAALNDVLTGCERVATTPLPIAYQIAFHQITWVYVLLLPFQLLDNLEWMTIPAAIAASYIILGILFIGNEIEDPFGQDVNDLPLDEYCAQIAAEMDMIASRKKPRTSDWVTDPRNKPLFPASHSPYNVWAARSEDKLRAAIRHKTDVAFEQRQKLSSREKGLEKVIGDESV